MAQTTRSRTARGVVVGVDGTPASVQAVGYATTEAARLGEVVDVVHVIPDYVPITGLRAYTPDDMTAAGREVITSTLRRVGPSADAVPLTSHVRHGAVVPTLVAAGRRARVVVVGSDRRPVALRLLTGNVSTGVAARCPAPVVSVPEGWDPDRTTGIVLAAVKHPRHAAALMSEAFEVARERGGRVVVMHVWQLPFAYDANLVSDREALDEWRRSVRRELDELAAPWRDMFPGVGVEVRSEQGQAAHALVSASAEADEMVIERSSHGPVAAAHLGATGRTVLLYAHCPVRVVPSSRVTRDHAVEAAGERHEQPVG